MATRSEKFQTPIGSSSTEKVAFESYVDAKINKLESDSLKHSNEVQTISSVTSKYPYYNATYFLKNNAYLIIMNPTSTSEEYPVITNPNSKNPTENLYSPAGVRVSIICTGDSSKFKINNVEYSMVKEQYYEFIYSGSSWHLINSWYARWN